MNEKRERLALADDEEKKKEKLDGRRDRSRGIGEVGCENYETW